MVKGKVLDEFSTLARPVRRVVYLPDRRSAVGLCEDAGAAGPVSSVWISRCGPDGGDRLDDDLVRRYLLDVVGVTDNGVRVSRDGSALAWSWRTKVFVYPITPGVAGRPPISHRAAVGDFAFSDGHGLVTVTGTEIGFDDPGLGRRARRPLLGLAPDDETFVSLAVAGDRVYLGSGAEGSPVLSARLGHDAFTAIVAAARPVRRLVSSPDGGSVAIVGDFHVTVLREGREPVRRGWPSRVRFVDYSSGRVIVVTADGDVTAWTPGSDYTRLPGRLSQPTDFAVSPDGRFAAVMYAPSGDVIVHDLTGAAYAPVPTVGRPTCLAWTGETRVLAVGYFDGVVRAWKF